MSQISHDAQLAASQASACRSCGAPIYWRVTEAGKPTPVNLDGTTHWATCPQAGTWHRRSTTSDSSTDRREA